MCAKGLLSTTAAILGACQGVSQVSTPLRAAAKLHPPTDASQAKAAYTDMGLVILHGFWLNHV